MQIICERVLCGGKKFIINPKTNKLHCSYCLMETIYDTEYAKKHKERFFEIVWEIKQ